MFYVIQHMDNEGPGIFRKLIPAGAKTVMAERDPFPEPAEDDVFVIMGGIMGVYESDTYPFIERELELIRACCRANARLLGVCLGAQMIAGALGGRVYKGHVQETGWYRVELTGEGRADNAFSVFPAEHEVFQWHGDTFDLPRNAVRLAGSSSYPNQAFRIGSRIYGLQYHVEVDKAILRDWFPDAKESALIDTEKLAFLEPLALQFLRRFIEL